MTTRHTITIDVADIAALEVRCANCPAVVSFPVGYEVKDFLNCPGCGRNLLDVETAQSRTLAQLAAALVKWKHISQRPFALTITLDFPS